MSMLYVRDKKHLLASTSAVHVVRERKAVGRLSLPDADHRTHQNSIILRTWRDLADSGCAHRILSTSHLSVSHNPRQELCRYKHPPIGAREGRFQNCIRALASWPFCQMTQRHHGECACKVEHATCTHLARFGDSPNCTKNRRTFIPAFSRLTPFRQVKRLASSRCCPHWSAWSDLLCMQPESHFSKMSSTARSSLAQQMSLAAVSSVHIKSCITCASCGMPCGCRRNPRNPRNRNMSTNWPSSATRVVARSRPRYSCRS
jgi:hypothetical protein